MFLPHPRVKVSIVGSLRDRVVACSASDRQGSNFDSCVWRTVSSQSYHHPQEVLLAQFSLYVHKGGLKTDSFYFIVCATQYFGCWSRSTKWHVLQRSCKVSQWHTYWQADYFSMLCIIFLLCGCYIRTFPTTHPTFFWMSGQWQVLTPRLPSEYKTFTWHLYNVWSTSKTLGRRCTNVMQMFCLLGKPVGLWLPRMSFTTLVHL